MLSKVLWNSLLAAPAILGAAILSSPAIAADAAVVDAASTDAQASVELPTITAPVQLAGLPVESVAQPSATSSVATLDQVIQYSNEGNGNGSLSQVTSVTEFSDVSPDDWAYEALSFLANSEAEGGLDCLEGYPDGTFKGGRAMTRFEFAAGLASCLDALTGRLSSLDPEALARIEALQREFAAELATLKGRVDALEAAVGELQENQFSTTTVLRGRAIFAFSDIFGNSAVEDVNNTVFQSRVRLNFDTSFTGEDRLRTRLQAGNFSNFNGIPANSIAPASEDFDETTDFSFDSGGDFNVRVSRLEYYFPLGPATVYLGAQGQGISDIVTSVSPFDDSEQGSLSYFGYNPIYDLGEEEQNIGFGVTLDLAESIQLGLGYLTGEGNNPDNSAGLFDGGYAAFGQLTFSPGNLAVALTYVNSYTSPEVDAGVFAPSVYNGYGVSVNYALADTINIGGWGTYIDTRTFAGPAEFRGDGEAWSYALTLGFEDLGLEGSLLGIIAGVPPYSGSFTNQIGSGNNAGAFHTEVFYRFAVSDNISVTPGVIWVSDVADTGDDIFIGVLRTSFKF